jgi:alpha-tubulin suppressor-like RCC1 family protein
LQKLKAKIVQIYCGEFHSFAVDQYGSIYAWGQNKNNCLLVNSPEIGIIKTIVSEPMEVKLPDYFIIPGKMNIV